MMGILYIYAENVNSKFSVCVSDVFAVYTVRYLPVCEILSYATKNRRKDQQTKNTIYTTKLFASLCKYMCTTSSVREEN